MGAASHGGTDARGFDKEFTRWTVPNVETLSGNKTITSTDARVQLLDPGVSDRDVTLDASLHVTGTLVYFQCTGASSGLVIKNSAGTELATLKYVYAHCRVIYNGSGWTFVEQPLMFQTGSRQYIGLRYGALSSGITSTAFGCGGSDAFVVTSSNLCYAASLGIGASPSSLFHVTAAGDANALRVDNTTGRIGIGTTPGNQKVRIIGELYTEGNVYHVGGDFYAFSSATPNATKSWNIKALDYASNVWSNVLSYTSTSGNVNMFVGNATNASRVYIQTLSSANMISVEFDKVGIGNSPSSLFHVTAAGDANALRVDNTTGHVAIGAVPGGGLIKLLVSKATADAYTLALMNTSSHASAGAGIHLYSDAGAPTGYLVAWSNAADSYAVHMVASIGDLKLTASAASKSVAFTAGAGGRVICQGTTSAFRPNVLTTTERDALTPVNGDFIYNSTTGKHEGYNGAWNACY